MLFLRLLEKETDRDGNHGEHARRDQRYGPPEDASQKEAEQVGTLDLLGRQLLQYLALQASLVISRAVGARVHLRRPRNRRRAPVVDLRLVFGIYRHRCGVTDRKRRVHLHAPRR